MSLLTSIRFQCPECGHAHHVPAAYEGKKGRCITCRTVLRVRQGLAERYVSSGSGSGADRRALHRSGVVVGIAQAARATPPRQALVAAVILACVLGLGSVTYAVTAIFRTPDDALACLPRDMTIVATLNTRDAVNELGLSQLVDENDAQLDELGVDFLDDVDAIYMGANPRMANQGGDGVVFMAEGRFDFASLRDKAAQDEGVEWAMHTHRGIPYWSAQDGTGGELAVALLRTDLVAMARPATLQQVIDTATGAAPSVYRNSDLRGMIEANRDRLVWLAIDLDDDMRSEVPGAQSVRSALISVDGEGGQVRIAGTARFTDSAEADQARAQLEGMVEALQQDATGLPVSLEGVLSDHSVSLVGQELSLDLSFDSAKVKQLAEQASQ